MCLLLMGSREGSLVGGGDGGDFSRRTDRFEKQLADQSNFHGSLMNRQDCQRALAALNTGRCAMMYTS